MKIKLKVLWLKNLLGFAIDQRTTTNVSPLTTYYFWPKTEAWAQLKLELDSKVWIKPEEKIKVLNTITEIIEDWGQNRNNKKSSQEFSGIEFIKVNE